LVIPVFRNLFFGPQKAILTGFLRIFFLPANSGGIFHRNVVLEGVAVLNLRTSIVFDVKVIYHL
jgi:pantothenate kinase type III